VGRGPGIFAPHAVYRYEAVRAARKRSGPIVAYRE